MRTVLAAALATALLSAAPLARAEPPLEKILALAQSSDGARVLLYTHAGPCVGEARFAEHISRAGDKTPGCWLVNQAFVMVSFLDGERGDIPVAQLKRPTDS
ncbi:MAG: hypothetical protein KIT17_11035 [Rubrivivax sp.]|nr:hypothetical protein [Rubrivivax sp.]